MKAVAMIVIIAGYSALVYGVNHVTGGCMPFRNVVWPSTTAVTDPCSSSTSSTASTGVNAGAGIGVETGQTS